MLSFDGVELLVSISRPGTVFHRSSFRDVLNAYCLLCQVNVGSGLLLVTRQDIVASLPSSMDTSDPLFSIVGETVRK